MKNIEVVAAIIICNDKLLCVQRGEEKYDYISRKWEFPGGKVEKNESIQNALKREIKEELSINLSKCSYFMRVEHDYPDFSIVMHSFLCNINFKEIHLNEHIDHKWLYPSELGLLDWAAADLPIVAGLVN